MRKYCSSNHISNLMHFEKQCEWQFTFIHCTAGCCCTTCCYSIDDLLFQSHFWKLAKHLYRFCKLSKRLSKRRIGEKGIKKIDRREAHWYLLLVVDHIKTVGCKSLSCKKVGGSPRGMGTLCMSFIMFFCKGLFLSSTEVGTHFLDDSIDPQGLCI